jgi:DNA mismatch repair protein MutL
MSIRILPPELVNRIAAGEVVERPASVVKELVENALDAGATRIQVSAGDGGRSIRVADNGCGMSETDALLAFQNHATSKLGDDDADLFHIHTLGFRGEALASVSAIARVTCQTRRAEDANGLQVSLKPGQPPSTQPVGCAVGTVMHIEDLFFNIPARLKFLKRPATELGHIQETVEMLALSHPSVRFTLELNGNPVLNTRGDGQLADTVRHIFKVTEPLLPVAFADGEELGVTGLVSPPTVQKSSKRWLALYVNQRHVRCPVLTRAVEAAMESLLPPGKYPVCALFLTLPSEAVDVNVHPSKREVRYVESGRVFAFVQAALREALSGVDPVTLPPRFASAPSGLGSQAGGAQTGSYGGPRLSGFGQAVTPTGERPTQLALEVYRPLSSPQGALAPTAHAPTTHDDTASPPSNSPPEERFRVIGQLYNTFILLETAQGLMVVDQHIASERVWFEQLQRQILGETPAVQTLSLPLPRPLRPTEREWLHDSQEDFARLGFQYTIENESLLLSGLPVFYTGRADALSVFDGLLNQLADTEQMRPNLDDMIATLACHSAVRAGDVLSPTQMEQVVTGWLASTLPWSCPHGRPIAHTIPSGELQAFFHRPSLPVNAF